MSRFALLIVFMIAEVVWFFGIAVLEGLAAAASDSPGDGMSWIGIFTRATAGAAVSTFLVAGSVLIWKSLT